MRKIDSTISSMDNNTSQVTTDTTSSSIQTCCYLAPLPSDLCSRYSNVCKKKLARVTLLDKQHQQNSTVRVLFKDFLHEDTLPVESLLAANRLIEQIQPAVESTSLYLDDGEKLEGLNEIALAELTQIVKEMIGNERLKASMVQRVVSKNRRVRFLGFSLCLFHSFFCLLGSILI